MKMGEPSLDTLVALLLQRISQLEKDILELQNEDEKIKTDVDLIKEMAGRWKGGFLTIAAMGGFVGWLISIWDKVSKPWH